MVAFNYDGRPFLYFTAFDADALICAAAPENELGRRVAALFTKTPGRYAGVGSTVLLPEVLGKPLRDGNPAAVRDLAALLSSLDLRPVDRAVATLATVLAARHRLRGADAIHLATAITMGAQRFITNNSRDFPPTISEIDITYPDDLPEALPGCFPDYGSALDDQRHVRGRIG